MEVLDADLWIEDPWLYFREAERHWGPDRARAHDAKRDLRKIFEKIRVLVPALEEPEAREVVQSLLHDADRRLLKRGLVAKLEEAEEWKGAPQEFTEFHQAYNTEATKERARSTSRQRYSSHRRQNSQFSQRQYKGGKGGGYKGKGSKGGKFNAFQN